MTWHYQIASDGSQMDIWDQTQDPSTDSPLTTLPNDGSGFREEMVLDVMREECAARNWDFTDSYVQGALKDAVFKQIKQR